MAKLFGSNTKEPTFKEPNASETVNKEVVTKEPNNEKIKANAELQIRLEGLQSEIEQARQQLKSSQARVTELQHKLDEYMGRERQIAEVMIIAQINAQRLEAQARAKAEVLIQETDEELRRKNQELELLRMKAQLFKQDLNERLEQFKNSVDRILDFNDDVSFTPTLVAKDKKIDQKMIG